MADLTESVEIAAPADSVWAMISDLTRMGEWSPENRGARWLGREKGPAVGATFVGFNAYKWLRWPTNGRVTVSEPGSRFSFEVAFGAIKVALWEYQLTPTDDGVTVTESWTDRRPRRIIAPLNRVFGANRTTLNTHGMKSTLAKLKKAAETA